MARAAILIRLTLAEDEALLERYDIRNFVSLSLRGLLRHPNL